MDIEHVSVSVLFQPRFAVDDNPKINVNVNFYFGLTASTLLILERIGPTANAIKANFMISDFQTVTKN